MPSAVQQPDARITDSRQSCVQTNKLVRLCMCVYVCVWVSGWTAAVVVCYHRCWLPSACVCLYPGRL